MRNKIQVAPSILGGDFLQLGKEVDWLNNSSADMIHIDMMDGHFVPNISLGFPVVEALMRVSRIPLDVHMMLSRPEDHIKRCAALGVARISVHMEASVDVRPLLTQIKSMGCQAGLAFNPQTSLGELDCLWELVDMVLIMSVPPGFAGQSFLEESVEKVRHACALRDAAKSKAQIAVDGGIDTEVGRRLYEAGADVLVIASALFSSPNRDHVLRDLKNIQT